VVKQGSIQAENVVPAVGTVANCAFEAAPEGVEDVVGVEDVAGQGIRGGAGQIAGGRGCVFIKIAGTEQQAEAGAGVEEAGEGFGLGAADAGEGRRRGRGLGQAVEEAERDGGEHGLGSAEGFDEVEDAVGAVEGHVLHFAGFRRSPSKVFGEVDR
jgi:hypothetical protein